MNNNIILDRDTEMCSNCIHFDTHVRVVGRRNGFIDHEVISPLHYRLSSLCAHEHIVEVWFDGGFWVKHVNNNIKFFVGNLSELRSALAIISGYCY